MTLTQTAVWTKRGVLGVIISLILGILGTIGYNMWSQYQLAHRPPVEEKPEMKFGILPELPFPPSNISSSNFSYSLDTTTGGLPQTPKLGKVYFIPQAGVSLLAPEKSQKLAANLGFPNRADTTSSSQYKFTDGKGGELTIDISGGNISFQRPPATASPSAQLNTPFTTKEETAASFKNYLASKNLLQDELRGGRTNAIFNKASPNQSDKAQVSLWPADLDNLPVVTPSFKEGLVNATLTTSGEESTRFIKVDYIFWPIDKTTSSTYPLKNAEQALAELRAGRGFISIEPAAPQVSISSAYLAYFESAGYSPYLQPVFVFEGPNFAAIVPAIVR